MEQKNEQRNKKDGKEENIETGQRCEDPDSLIELVSTLESGYKKVLNQLKSVKNELEMVQSWKKKLEESDEKLTIEDNDQFIQTVQTSHQLLTRIEVLEEENTRMKETVLNLKNELDNLEKVKLSSELETKDKMLNLENNHKEQLVSITEKYTKEAENKRKTYEEKIAKFEQDLLDLQMKNSQLQSSKEVQLTQLSMEYEGQIAKLQRQKLQNQQNQNNSYNQEIFRKKLQHMKEEYEQEITGLKQEIEKLQAGYSPSPRSKQRLTLTTGTKRKR